MVFTFCFSYFKNIISFLPMIFFQLPPTDSHNGPLRGFKIAYRLEGVASINFTIKKIESPTASQGNIDGLLQFTIYEIKVLAYNDAGNGKYSAPITVTTAEGGESVQ